MKHFEKERTIEKLRIDNLEKEKVSIIIPISSYQIGNDKRLLIPFISNSKIGFIHRDGIVAVDPIFDTFKGDIFSHDDYIQVGVSYSYAYERGKKAPEIYTRHKWGILNSKGDIVLEPKYSSVIKGTKSFIVRKAYGYDYDGAHALLNIYGEIVVPYGVYKEIEPFENGLARCRNYLQEEDNRIELFGVIDEEGQIVLECTNRHIMPFYGRYRRMNISSIKEIIRQENPMALNKYFSE